MKPLRVAVQFTLDCRRRCVVKLGLHWLCRPLLDRDRSRDEVDFGSDWRFNIFCNVNRVFQAVVVDEQRTATRSVHLAGKVSVCRVR